VSRRTILTTIIIPGLLISGLILFLVNNQREFPGELVLSQNQIDFGMVPEWEAAVDRTVTARNIGKETLYIKRMESGCSFAEIEGPKVIKSKTEETFKVIVDPQYVPPEKTTATAIFFTDSSKTPQVYLTIITTGMKFATLSAEVCDFAEVETDMAYEKLVRLCVNAPMNREEIHLLPTGNPMLTWDIEPESGTDCFVITIRMHVPSREKLIDVKSQNTTGNMPFSSLLTVAFPNDRTLTLPVIARLVGPVSVQPETLSFGAVSGSTVPHLEFTISAKKDFEIVTLEVQEHLQVTDISDSVEPKKDSPYFERRFKVTLDVLKSPTYLREEILIRTSLTSVPVRIPVFGFIRSR